ncbi:hypothetical protein ACFL05_00990 [Patescibacteria group bacterium]
MSVNKIETPENTVIPTPQSAVQGKKQAIEKVARIQNKKAVILKYVYELNGIVSHMWQGCAHLESLSDDDSVSTGEYFRSFWEKATSNSLKDAKSFGLTVSQFIAPDLVCRYIPSARHSPRVGVSINRMLDCQFHLEAKQSDFLLRHLGLRIVLKAFAEINNHVDSKFLKTLNTISFPERWIDVPEIKAATAYHDEDCLSNRFSYLIIKEIELMADLFELLLIKLHE